MDDVLTWLVEYINTLRRTPFYGKIVIEIKEGKIILLRREETIKPPQSSSTGKLVRHINK